MPGLDLIIKRDPEEDEAGEVFIDGSAGGRRYRFLLDTGAATSRLASDEYTMGLASIESRPSSGVFRAGSEDLVTLPSIQIGPISRAKITVARAAPGAGKVANLIGMDVLKDFCLLFDFAHNHLEVDPAGDPGEGHDFHRMLLDARSHPYVEVRFGQTAASAVWDSGASLTVADAGFVSRHPDFFREAGRSTGIDSTGAEVTTPVFIMDGAAIGGAKPPPHRVAVVDLSGVNATIEIPMDLILGYSTLRHGDWLLDFPRARWALLRMGPKR